MGVLNCQKCINEENKIINELLLEGKKNKSRRVITALESQDTNSTPPKMAKYLNEEKVNSSNFSKNERLKRIYLEIKKGNKEAIYDLDYNTLDIINNESDSYLEFPNEDIENDFKDINHLNDNDNVEDFDEIYKIFKTNGNNDLDINDFINKKIKESQNDQIKEEFVQNNEIIDNLDNYKIVYDKNMNNYQNNFKYNGFSDLELSEDGNNLNDKIIEEKEEYENEESSFKDIKELKNNSANLTQTKNKSIEINKKSIKSEKIKKKEKTNEKENKFNNKSNIFNNSNSVIKQIAGKSITSYELESDNPNIENCNNINDINNSNEK